MPTYAFQTVDKLIYGPGSLRQLPQEAAALGRRALVVCGGSALRSGVAGQVVEGLRRQGLDPVLFAEVRGEPTLPVVEAGIQRLRQEGCDLVIGIGGGSGLDAAKAIAALSRQPEPATAYFRGGGGSGVRGQGSGAGGGGSGPIGEGSGAGSGGGTLPAADPLPVPWIAVPTTAGSGAEVTSNAVLVDPATGIKKSIRDPRWYARVAVVDPELTLSCPPEVTAHSGMDALTQAIEAHVSRKATPLTLALSGQAALLVGRNLLAAYRNGQDLGARERVMYGSTMAGMALANARLGLVHGLAHPVGMACEAPHGLVCAVLLPAVMEFNAENPEVALAYGELAEALGVGRDGASPEDARSEGARSLIAWVRSLQRELEVPPALSALGLRREHIPRIVEETLPSGSTQANPRPVTSADLEALLEAQLWG